MKNQKVSQFSGVLIFLFLSAICLADGGPQKEGMAQMPVLKPEKSYPATGNEDSNTGFGDEAPMVNMMNQMMVGGSGYEGMDMKKGNESPTSMEGMDHMHNKEASSSNVNIRAEVSPNPVQTGPHQIDLFLSDSKTKKPISGLNLQVSTAMTSMDMGTEVNPVKEIESGHYQFKSSFTMNGPWAVALKGPHLEKTLTFQVGSKEKWKLNP